MAVHQEHLLIVEPADRTSSVHQAPKRRVGCTASVMVVVSWAGVRGARLRSRLGRQQMPTYMPAVE